MPILALAAATEDIIAVMAGWEEIIALVVDREDIIALVVGREDIIVEIFRLFWHRTSLRLIACAAEPPESLKCQ